MKSTICLGITLNIPFIIASAAVSDLPILILSFSNILINSVLLFECCQQYLKQLLEIKLIKPSTNEQFNKRKKQAKAQKQRAKLLRLG